MRCLHAPKFWCWQFSGKRSFRTTLIPNLDWLLLLIFLNLISRSCLSKVICFLVFHSGICFISTWTKRLSNAFAIVKYKIKPSLTHLYSLVNCLNTNSESPLIFMFFAPSSSKISKPIIKASYSASLFEAVNYIRRIYFSLSPWGDVSMTPAPAPSFLLDPSKCIVQR